MTRWLIIVRWLTFISFVLDAMLATRDAAAAVNWDPVGASTDFEDPNNWDPETYTPVPPEGNEVAPPGPNSNFFIREGNYTVILSDPRTGTGSDKLGTFTIGAGTYAMDDPGTTEVETVGPGDEIMTLYIQNSVNFLSLDRNAVGTPISRPVRIGHEDNQPEARLNGELDFPWGIVLHQAGTFTVESNTNHTDDQIRIGGAENVQGGGIYEISGTAKLNVATDKIRVGDRATASSSANGVFRIRGSTMGTSKSDPAVRVGDDFEIESSSGFWDTDRPAAYENRLRFNRGKGVLEFVLDAGGVTPLFVADAIKIGDDDTVNTNPNACGVCPPDEDTIQYSPGFLRVKLSRPLLATTPGMTGQSPLTLVWADRITTQFQTIPNPEQYPLYPDFSEGRFFDPDRDGEAVFPNGAPDPAPHRFLPSVAQVISDYAGATYTWTIEYFEDGTPAGGDNGVVDSYVRLVNGTLSGTIGDLNDDSVLNDSDRQALIDAVASPPVTRYQMLGQAQNLFDLNADDFINELDLDVFNTYILPPDYNQNDVVDAADYVTWRKFPTGFHGDPVGYNIWRRHFGQSSPGGGGASGPVPEPASFMLILAGVVAMLFRRQR